MLEFLGMTNTLWLPLIECKEMGLVNELILILGGNISAIYWIIRSSLHTTSVYCSTVLFVGKKRFWNQRTLPCLIIYQVSWTWSLTGYHLKEKNVWRTEREDQSKIQLLMITHPRTLFLAEFFLLSPRKKTGNLTESIYFTKINRKLAKHAQFLF